MTRTRSLVGLALASTVLLTGCNDVSGWNPGVAARVGDETILLSEVQDTTTTYCAAVETQLQEGQAVANSVVASQVAASLALRSAAEQWAASEGVEPGAEYDTEAESLEQAIAGLSEEQQDAVRAVNLAQPYLDAVELAVGQQEASGSGANAARKAGQKAFASWLADQDVQVDPRYAVTLEDGGIARVQSQVSYPVSDTARSAGSIEADDTYVTGLPSTQRCGG